MKGRVLLSVVVVVAVTALVALDKLDPAAFVSLVTLLLPSPLEGRDVGESR